MNHMRAQNWSWELNHFWPLQQTILISIFFSFYLFSGPRQPVVYPRCVARPTSHISGASGNNQSLAKERQKNHPFFAWHTRAPSAGNGWISPPSLAGDAQRGPCAQGGAKRSRGRPPGRMTSKGHRRGWGREDHAYIGQKRTHWIL